MNFGKISKISLFLRTGTSKLSASCSQVAIIFKSGFTGEAKITGFRLRCVVVGVGLVEPQDCSDGYCLCLTFVSSLSVCLVFLAFPFRVNLCISVKNLKLGNNIFTFYQ